LRFGLFGLTGRTQLLHDLSPTFPLSGAATLGYLVGEFLGNLLCFCK
jgi:hypothetical protein